MEKQRGLWTGGPSEMEELSAMDGCKTWKEKLWSESGILISDLKVVVF